jgi:hypothetical protein
LDDAHSSFWVGHYERAAMTFNVGDEVEKKKGYRWPGVVVAAFQTTAGEPRVVVECTVPEVEGALHIYHPDQLRQRP